jgi:hypothetical protein
MTIVGNNPDVVVGAVDTHADVHVAAVVNHVGGVLGVEAPRRAGNRTSVCCRARRGMSASCFPGWCRPSGASRLGFLMGGRSGDDEADGSDHPHRVTVSHTLHSPTAGLES